MPDYRVSGIGYSHVTPFRVHKTTALCRRAAAPARTMDRTPCVWVRSPAHESGMRCRSVWWCAVSVSKIAPRRWAA